MMHKKKLAAALAFFAALLVYLLTRPFLFFSGDMGTLLAVPAEPGTAFSIRFIHSVQKTPVWENLLIAADGKGFDLQSTRYQSFGVGLPFLLSEGDFRREGDFFVIDHFDRHFDQLALRTGVGTKLTILYCGAEYPLHRQLAPGSKIELKVAPYYARFL